MGHVELKNKAVEWLWKQSAIFKAKSCKFSPKEITDQVGGVHTSLGKIKDEVMTELEARGVNFNFKVC